MKTKFAIIGGGTAGLCAAIRLSELGEEPIVIEGGSYPAHKICGEFLSPECIQVLHEWHIQPFPITQLMLKTSTSKLTFSFPSPAGGLSHLQLDPALAHHATLCGAKIKTNTLVTSFKPKQHSHDVHLIQLSNGETLEVSHVIIATGRIPSYSIKAPLMTYLGFKTHFKNIPSDGHLEMFSFPGAYLGIAPIEDNKFNVAGLAYLKKVKNFSHPHAFIEHLISQSPYLKSCFNQGENLLDQWMVTTLPAFGIKKTPDWLDTYFIGDAAVSIPPACGNGLAMAILGGRLAAEYSMLHKAEDFKIMWLKRCSSQMYWGKLLHKLMLNPFLGNPLLRLSHYFPCISKKVFDLTRQRN